MAADNTGGAILRLGYRYWIGPGSKGYLGANMFHLRTGMGIVAGHTVTPLLHIDMEVMEIVLTVSEVGQSFGKFLLGDILIMTTKTELVILGPVLLVKFLRKILGENAAIL